MQRETGGLTCGATLPCDGHIVPRPSVLVAVRGHSGGIEVWDSSEVQIQVAGTVEDADLSADFHGGQIPAG